MFLNKCICLCQFLSKYNKKIVMPFYAVAVGRKIGIYDTWSECEKQVKGFTGAKFKKFPSESEAKCFINENGPGMSNIGSIISNKANSISYLAKACNKSNIAKFSNYNSKANFSTYKRKSESNSDSKLDQNKVKDNIFDDDEEIDDEMLKLMDNLENKGKDKGKGKRTILIDPIICSTSGAKRSIDDNSYGNPKKFKNDNESFEVNESGYTVVYTDGACSKNGSSAAKAGLGVYFGENHSLNISEPVSGRATNNCGEIQAATKAIYLAYSRGVKKLLIKTDSKFVINSITKWIKGWKKNDWKLASGGPVKNEFDFKELDQATELMDEVKWEYVEAHKGILGNEKADQLAREGAARYCIK